MGLWFVAAVVVGMLILLVHGVTLVVVLPVAGNLPMAPADLKPAQVS